MGRTARRRVCAILGCALTAGAAVGAALVTLPPPTYRSWFFSIVAIEGSLLLTVPAAAGLALAGAAARLGARRTGAVTAAVAGVVLVVAVVPTLSAARTARQEGVRLSPAAYVAGPATSSARRPGTVAYARVEGTPLRADVWSPRRPTDRPAPAVVVVHGGGWRGGTRGDLPRWNAWLTDRGFVVFDVDYRLTPPPRWRDAPGDVACAVGWVKRNAGRYGVDPARIVLLGRSAGGHLALLAAYGAGDPRLPPSCPAPDTSVAAVVALYAPADLAFGYRVPVGWSHPPATARVGRQVLRALTGGTPDTAATAYAAGSPTTYVRAGLPPTLLVHGGRDRLVVPADTTRLAGRLAAAGAPYELLEIPYADHGFDTNWGGWGSQVLRPRLAAFLARV